MDYSICQALKRFPQHQRVLIIYDICCQWIFHFRERVSESEFLELCDSMEITGTVGKWHLAAHIAECFPKFSLNFVKGAGEVEGEILETLWSVMDEIALMAQAMLIAHHQEVVDDHMNNSNWCKIIQIGKCLLSMPSNLTVVPRRFIMREMEASTRGCFHNRSSI
jgi:Kyakuja-Dileera-Zisupton transposase